MITDGRLEAFFETGTEGIYWSLIDPALPGYDGLHILKDGDQLSILSDDGNELWQGTISLEYESNIVSGDNQQSVLGYWIHGLQTGINAEQWANYFFDSCRARLINDTKNIHPFKSESVRDSLLLMDAKPLNELYRSAIYGWINWSGHRVNDDTGEYWSVSKVNGIHTQLGLTESKALTLIGSPTSDEIKRWQLQRPTKVDIDRLVTLARLYQLIAPLIVRFGSNASIAI